MGKMRLLGSYVHVRPWGWGMVRDVGELVTVELLDWRLAHEEPVLMYLPRATFSGTSDDSAAAEVLGVVGGCVLLPSGETGVRVGFDRVGRVSQVRLSADGSVRELRGDEIVRDLPAACDLSVWCEYGKGKVKAYRADTGFFEIELPWGCVYMHEDQPGLMCPAAVGMPSAHMIASRVSAVKSMVRNHVQEDNLALWAFRKFTESDSGDLDMGVFLKNISRQMSQEIDTRAGDVKASIMADGEKVLATPKKVSFLLNQVRNRVLGIKDLDGGGLGTDIEEVLRRIDATSRELLSDSLAKNPFDKVDMTYLKELAAKYKDHEEVQEVLLELDGLRNMFSSRAALISSALTKSKTAQTVSSGLTKIRRRLSTNSEIGDLLQSKQKDLMAILRGETARETGSALWSAASERLTESVAMLDMRHKFIQDLDQRVEGILRDMQSGEGGQTEYISLALLLGMMNELSARFSSIKEDMKAGLESWETRVEVVLAESFAVTLARTPKITGHDLLMQITHPARALATLRGRLNSAEHRALRGIGRHSDVSVGVAGDSSNSKTLRDLIEGFKPGKIDMKEVQKYFSQNPSDHIDGEMAQLMEQVMKAGDGLLDNFEALRDHVSVRGFVSTLKENDLHELAAASLDPTRAVQGAGSIFNQAELMLTDAKARERLVDSTKDQLVDFLLTFVPDMSIPDYEDIQNDVDYAIADLDISSFKVRKEDVQISINEDPLDFGKDFMRCSAKGISASFEGIRWRFAQNYFPHMSGEGVTEATVENLSVALGFKLIRVPVGVVKILEAAKDSNGKAAELFSVYQDKHFKSRVEAARARVGATTKKASTELAGLKESDDELARLWSGTDMEDSSLWEPAMVLNPAVSAVRMESLKLITEGSSLSWVYNSLSNSFSSVIKDYVCQCLSAVIHDRLAQLLGNLNHGLANHMHMLKSLVDLNNPSIPVASSLDLAALIGPPLVQLTGPQKDYTLKVVDSEDQPLGIALVEEERTPTVRRTLIGQVSAKGLIASAAKKAGCDKCLIGSTVRRINGLNVLRDDRRRVANLLSGSRPLYLTVRLSDAGYAMLKAESRNNAAAEAVQTLRWNKSKRKLKAYCGTFEDGPIGLKLKETRSCGGAVIVMDFARDGDKVLQAEAQGVIKKGYLMLSVAGAGVAEEQTLVFGKKFEAVMNIIKTYSRPLRILFVPSPDEEIVFTALPGNLEITRIADHIIVTQASSLMKVGTSILQVNGVTVGKSATAEEVMAKLQARKGTGAPTTVAVRDLDSFMHLIRLRDGLENLTEHVELASK